MPINKRAPKKCSCCSQITEPLEQWWNQDDDWGLCEPCADWIEGREGKERLEKCYGKRGIHIGKREEY